MGQRPNCRLHIQKAGVPFIIKKYANFIWKMVIATKLDAEEDILENAVSHNKVLVKDLMITCTLKEEHVKDLNNLDNVTKRVKIHP